MEIARLGGALFQNMVHQIPCWARSRSGHARFTLATAALTDAEWVTLGPCIPPDAKCGRKRAYPMREVVNALRRVLRCVLLCVRRDGIA